MIENLKDLKALLKLCRQAGVTEITVGTTSLKLGETPRPVFESSDDSQPEMVDDILDSPLTPEELVSWSQGGN